jgi:hypothetical protein
MKNMKKYIKSSFIVALLGTICLTSCSDDKLASLNIDENNPTSVTPNVLLTNAENKIFSDQGGFGDGFIGQFSQHFAGNHSTAVDYDQYELTHGSFASLFNDAYLNSLKDCERIIKTSKTGDEKYVGIAKILTAYKLGYLTSLYGDIPYSEALNLEAHLNPKYDKQEAIYTSIQSLLTQAIVDIDKGTADLKGDFIFDGDTDKWKATAYLLSARFHNHFSKKDPAGSATRALAAIDKAKLIGMNSSDWDLVLKYEGTSLFQNPWVSLYNNGMIVANKPFLDNLITSGDPRTEAFFARENNDGVDVTGLGKIQSGAIGTGEYAIVGGTDSFYGKAASSVPCATYAELLMIEAEAAFRSGNLPRAALAHNKAIQVHIDQVTSLPIGIARKAAYIAAHASETSASITLSKIMTEKHILMFTMSVESWMDVRRHNYSFPSWATIPLNTLETAPIGTKFIQRILYPQSELNLNSANVPITTIYDKLPILQ